MEAAYSEKRLDLIPNTPRRSRFQAADGGGIRVRGFLGASVRDNRRLVRDGCALFLLKIVFSWLTSVAL